MSPNKTSQLGDLLFFLPAETVRREVSGHSLAGTVFERGSRQSDSVGRKPLKLTSFHGQGSTNGIIGLYAASGEWLQRYSITQTRDIEDIDGTKKYSEYV